MAGMAAHPGRLWALVRWFVVGVAGALYASATPVGPSAQTSDPSDSSEPKLVFRSAVDLVRLAFTVRHDDGHLVTDLTPADFRVLVDGRPTSVAFFDSSPRPLIVAAMHYATSGLPSLAVVRLAGRALVDALDLAIDAAAIGTFSQEVAISPSFSQDIRTLHRVLDEELWPMRSWPRLPAAGIDLGRAAVAAAPGNRRRAVVVISPEGVWNSRTDFRFEDVVRRALEADVVVYSFRLEPEEERFHVRPMLSPLAFATGGGFREVVVRGPCFDLAGFTEYLSMSYEARLRRCRPDEDPALLADLRNTAAQIVKEIRHEYLLGVTVPTVGGDRDRSVRVQVLRADMTAAAIRQVVEARRP